MAHTITYQIKLDKTIKQKSFAVFHELGITPTEAVQLFLNTVAQTKSIPFPIHIPNAQTQQVFAETDVGINLNKADSVEDLFKQLEI
jgi:DNA-damage-inducible protein J